MVVTLGFHSQRFVLENPLTMDPPDDPRESKEKVVRISKRLFILGFFALPWLWLINFFYFRKLLSHSATPPVAKRFVYLSLTGFVLVVGGWLVWFIVYLNNWTHWGTTGEDFSVLIPYGSS